LLFDFGLRDLLLFLLHGVEVEKSGAEAITLFRNLLGLLHLLLHVLLLLNLLLLLELLLLRSGLLEGTSTD